MTILSGVILITLMVHLFLFILNNQWRVRKLVIFIDKFRDEDLLAKEDHEILYDRYSSFLSYMEFFPDKQEYRLLYENKEFDSFVTSTRKRLKYYAIVTAICFALLAVLVSTINPV